MILFFFLDDWNSLKGAKGGLRWFSLGPAVFTETNQPNSLVDLGHRWGFSWPFQFTYSFEYLECIPSSARADHMTVSIFSWRTSRLISIGLELTFLPIDSEYSPLFSPSSSAFVDFVFLVTILTGKKWNLSVVFVCLSLMIKSAEHFPVELLTIFTSFGKCSSINVPLIGWIACSLHFAFWNSSTLLDTSLLLDV